MAAFEELRERVRAAVRTFPDFPQPGVQFCDIMPLMRDPQLVDELCARVADEFRGRVDVVAALEARGFLFAPLIAVRLGVSFVPVRKRGKLPGPTLRATYTKEYGEDVIEVQADAFAPEQRVLLFDDLLATGGTLAAAVQLVEAAGARFTAAFVLVELPALGGRQRVDGERVTSLLSF
ncbi:Adenine phosphoribosyltransferase [Aphelenchoides fujianensis]|nr:Adenine phosphoribosyltransferase [Aphelenchoides fujianensis]KAI6242445.1 Adenine phosphoribosyltransferase [Aphelenchoides fujianensis]KAI6242450.1 Adenine phosphoribosyltransferase [Aphelenchoides fujianensis]